MHDNQNGHMATIKNVVTYISIFLLFFQVILNQYTETYNSIFNNSRLTNLLTNIHNTVNPFNSPLFQRRFNPLPLLILLLHNHHHNNPNSHHLILIFPRVPRQIFHPAKIGHDHVGAWHHMHSLSKRGGSIIVDMEYQWSSLHFLKSVPYYGKDWMRKIKLDIRRCPRMIRSVIVKSQLVTTLALDNLLGMGVQSEDERERSQDSQNVTCKFYLTSDYIIFCQWLKLVQSWLIIECESWKQMNQEVAKPHILCI